MASNFSANQFEPEFAPARLGNWEVPKWHRGQPIHRTNTTKIISNDRGHLLPGVVRPKTSPWGNFKGTWQLPKRITKEDCIDLSGPVVGTNRWNTPLQTVNLNKNQCCRNTSRTDTKSAKLGKEIKAAEKLELDAKLAENIEYIPGNLTIPQQAHHTQDALIDRKKNEIIGKECEPILNPLYTEKHSCSDNVELLNEQDNKRREQTEHILSEVEILPNDKLNEKMRQEVTEKPGESNTVPLVPAYYNFDMARRMAQENLEHQPLPDSIMDRAFRKLQAQGVRNPEMALDVFPTATGVGVRTHNAGPTHCTKLKVYRPKTCGVVPKPLDESRISSRPNTALMDNMRPMDLAICWDYRPTNPHDEPKPPTHIDGSNGSAAPAVFTLVKTPRTADDLGTGRSGGVFSNTLGEEGFFEKDVMLRNKNLFSAKLEANTNRECKCGMSAESNRQRQSSRNHLTDTRPRCKSSPNLSTIVHASNSVDTLPQKENIIVCNYNQEHYHVRPVSHKHRPHRARNNSLDKGKSTRAPRLCEQNQSMPMIGQQVQPQHVHRPELKVPFKAGIPKSNSSGTCTSFDSGCSSMSAGSACSAKLVKIPKPKNPYAKKSYIIDTLAPPFACWKGGAGQGGYPEHWRLASVYQHAYKPVQQRKRPLLATVYQ